MLVNHCSTSTVGEAVGDGSTASRSLSSAGWVWRRAWAGTTPVTWGKVGDRVEANEDPQAIAVRTELPDPSCTLWDDDDLPVGRSFVLGGHGRR